jgi:nucleotide-binding universal stress UspA family protein
MYKTIMVPVDLERRELLDKALSTAADLARHYDAAMYLVGVTAAAPSAVAHNPEEFADNLEKFGSEQAAKHGVPIKTKSMLSHDPAIDLDDVLERAASELGADLIVMASHVPGFTEHVFASNAGYLAMHTSLSVFVVR